MSGILSVLTILILLLIVCLAIVGGMFAIKYLYFTAQSKAFSEETLSQISMLRDNRIILGETILKIFGDVLPHTDIIGIRNLLNQYHTIKDEEQEIRWEYSWFEAMRTAFENLGEAISKDREQSYCNLKAQFEENEKKLSDIRNMQAQKAALIEKFESSPLLMKIIAFNDKMLEKYGDYQRQQYHKEQKKKVDKIDAQRQNIENQMAYATRHIEQLEQQYDEQNRKKAEIEDTFIEDMM